MQPDDVETDASLVERLLAEQFPAWADLPIQLVVHSGTDNATYRIGVDLAARFPRRKNNVERLQKELVWLPRLAPHLPLAIPFPRAAGEPGAGYPFPWSIFDWLPGETATPDRLDDPRRTSHDLARFITALEQIDSADGPRPGAPNAFRGAPLATRDAGTRASIEALRETIDADAATAAWDAALRVPEWRGDPVWVHGDLDARNLIAVEGVLSAVIDFGCLGVGDPACDVMVAWKMLDAETRDVFRLELPVDDATWARGRGWALSQAVHALAYYTEETNPVLVGEARRWLNEVLADG